MCISTVVFIDRQLPYHRTGNCLSFLAAGAPLLLLSSRHDCSKNVFLSSTFSSFSANHCECWRIFVEGSKVRESAHASSNLTASLPMSYLHTMAKNKLTSLGGSPSRSNATVPSVHVGGIDVLIVSGTGPEPLFQMLKKDQVKSDAASAYLKFLKESKVPGKLSGWAWSFDMRSKWHQIDNWGTVCPPLPLCAPPFCPSPLASLASPSPLPHVPTPHSSILLFALPAPPCHPPLHP